MITFTSRRRLLTLLAVLGLCFVVASFLTISGQDIKSQLRKIPLPNKPHTAPEHESAQSDPPRPPSLQDDIDFDSSNEQLDSHPIVKLVELANRAWRQYDGSRSRTFSETVSKYRRNYGRHPPPGFKDWYRFARGKNVYNIDDFEQIMDDLRPFWAIEAHIVRDLAAHMWEKEANSVAGIHIRNHKIANQTNGSWRSENMVTIIEKFVKYLPDMDIAVNRMDQPRVVVPWNDMQALLTKEVENRQSPPETIDQFTTGMLGFANTTVKQDETPREDPEWYAASGRQYMDIARTACPPESRAQLNGSTLVQAETLYKDHRGGLITNFNRSTDLCTIGPEIQDKHGFLFSSSSISATKRLVPVFSECKVGVNSDILYPANMYYKHDYRYDYDGEYDFDWPDKKDIMIWRGVTSGGVQTEDNWQKMHRQRLVMLANRTDMEGKEVRILTEVASKKGEYENFDHFQPSGFAESHTDVGFVEAWGCIPPSCPFYENVWTMKPQVELSEQFKYRFLVDVDGHSFSGRWRAFLESKSLGIKATIFREWHDSRLFAWRHFVPMDNRFDDLYTLLTYFIGIGKPDQGEALTDGKGNHNVYVARHDMEGKRIAQQGREWAKKVLRRDDMEVSRLCPCIGTSRLVSDLRYRYTCFASFSSTAGSSTTIVIVLVIREMVGNSRSMMISALQTKVIETCTKKASIRVNTIGYGVHSIGLGDGETVSN